MLVNLTGLWAKTKRKGNWKATSTVAQHRGGLLMKGALLEDIQKGSRPFINLTLLRASHLIRHGMWPPQQAGHIEALQTTWANWGFIDKIILTRSSAVTGSPTLLLATTMLPSLHWRWETCSVWVWFYKIVFVRSEDRFLRYIRGEWCNIEWFLHQIAAKCYSKLVTFDPNRGISKQAGDSRSSASYLNNMLPVILVKEITFWPLMNFSQSTTFAWHQPQNILKPLQRSHIPLFL